MTLEALTRQLIGALGDDLDHPEIWSSIHHTPKTQAESLKLKQNGNLTQFANYLKSILEAEQSPKITKALMIIYSVCIASLGDELVAQKNLEELSIKYPESPLVAGALFHIHHLLDPENPKFNFKNKICPIPFQQMDILENSVHLCCASWLPKSIGNTNTQDWHEVWNSNVAKSIRTSIFDGSYRYCNKMLCPRIQAGILDTASELRKQSADWQQIIDQNKINLEKGPETVLHGRF